MVTLTRSGDRALLRAVAEACDQAGEEAVRYLMAGGGRGSMGRMLTRYWRDWRPISLAITGHDVLRLGVAPGPEVAKRLARVKEAVANREILPGRPSELRFLKEMCYS